MDYKKDIIHNLNSMEIMSIVIIWKDYNLKKVLLITGTSGFIGKVFLMTL